MIILGIETSCDETGLCLLETQADEYRIIVNIVDSQINLHKEYGGVFPMLAKREHIRNLPILYKQLPEIKIDAIAVTQGPGLEPALWTGIVFAKELGKKLGIPVIPVNHMEGHILSTLLQDSLPSTNFEKLKPFGQLQFPALALLISGGHTEIVGVESLGNYKILGRTRDDAVGEAFDKTARMLGLPYPGGPEVSKLADSARKMNLPKTISLPRPMIHSKDIDFSFSGLKTAVLYTLKEIQETGSITENQKKEICREFEDAVTEVLISKVKKVIEEDEYKILIIGGGVIANKYIRKAFQKLAEEFDIPLYLPADGLTGDNALMIALTGSFQKSSDVDFEADGNLSLNSSRKKD